MLAGQAATFVSPVGPLGGSVDPFLPADLDGSTLPPAGAPNTLSDFPAKPRIQITPRIISMWISLLRRTRPLPPLPIRRRLVSPRFVPATRACVPQNGVTSSNYLDGIGDRLMFRLAYRNFGDHESVVGNLHGKLWRRGRHSLV